MNHPATASLAAGTSFFGGELPLPWPVQAAGHFHEIRLTDGSVFVALEPNGRIVFCLFEDLPGQGGMVGDKPYRSYRLLDKVSSQIIDCQISNRAAVTIRWQGRKFGPISINDAMCDEAAAPLVLKDDQFVNTLPPIDFSEKNADAVDQRRHKLAGWNTKPGRTAAGSSYAFEMLAGELNQIADLAKQIQEGKEHHVPGLATRVRMLVYGRPMGLIQTCAAHIDAPLILHTIPRPDDRPPIEEGVWIGVNGRVEVYPPFNNPIDLDVWLNTWALRIDRDDFTIMELIKQIGDTIGAHLDIDQTDPMRALMKSRGAVRQFHDVTTAVLQVSAILLALGRILISDKPS